MPKYGRPVIQIELSKDEEDFLQRICRKRNSPTTEVKRAKAILLMSEGRTNKDIAKEVGFCAGIIGTLRIRFDEMRLDGLSDLPRSGPTRKLNDERIEELIEKTLHSKPQGAHARWHKQWASPAILSRASGEPLISSPAERTHFKFSPILITWIRFGLS